MPIDTIAVGAGAASGAGAGSGGSPDPVITPSTGGGDGAGTGTGGGEHIDTGAGGDKGGTGAEDEYSFKFEGDEEHYTFKPEGEEGAAGKDDLGYDASKPFDPKIEEALKDNPEALKAMKAGHFELRRWKENGFKSPEALKAHMTEIKALGGLDKIKSESQEWSNVYKSFQVGDPKVIEQWFQDNPEGMSKLMRPALQKYYDMNPQGWGKYMAETFMSTLSRPNAQGLSAIGAFNQLYHVEGIQGNAQAEALLDQVADLINGVDRQAKANPEAEAGDTKLSKKEQELNKREGNLYLQSVNTKVMPLLDAAARQAMKVALKGRTISKDAGNQLLIDIKNNFNARQKVDDTFNKNSIDLLIQRNTDGFIRVFKSAVPRNMPQAAQEEVKKRLAFAGDAAQRKAEGQARTESQGGSTTAIHEIKYSGPLVHGGPDPKIIDYQAMRAKVGRKGADEMLENHKFIKIGDSKNTWVW
jgi:hypothetical protein